MCLLLVIISFSGVLISAELPSGWRFPTSEDLAGNFIREQSTEKYVNVAADFNGDGKIDYAYIVKSTSFSGEALLVNISNKEKYNWVVLNKIDWGEKFPKVSISMGVSIVNPGDYKTACGKGYWKCKDDEIPLLKLKLPAINYFRFESAASIYYWDKSSNDFKRIWISD